MPEKNGAIAVAATPTLHSEERLFPPTTECSEISVTCYRTDFSASRISRAVEDADAHVLNLNVTSQELSGGHIVIDLRVSHRDASAVIRSLERYGYTTIALNSGDNSMADSIAERIGLLMAQIEV